LGGLFVRLKLLFLHAFDEGSYNGAKVFNESVIERGQSMEASYFHDGGGSKPTLDSLNFRFNNLNSLTGHNIVEKDNLRSENLTLLMLAI